MVVCDHREFKKGSRYWVCDNNFCFLTKDELDYFTK